MTIKKSEILAAGMDVPEQFDCIFSPATVVKQSEITQNFQQLMLLLMQPFPTFCYG